MSAPRLSAGQVVAGKFSIRALLGYGGATATYSAQMPPGRDVVIKLFSPQIAQRPDILGVLQLVATVSSSLGESAAAVLESGFDPQTGAPYLVTDLSPQPSLAQVVEKGVLTPPDAVVILRGIAKAVDAAHAQRLAHGALKPQNVFVGPAPTRAVKVADFGVAVARAAVPSAEGFAIAAPWMAPEQMQGTPGAAPADVFSAALVAFHALTGKSFWRSCQGPQPDLGGLQQEVGAARPAASVRARELGANLPVALDGALGRALSLNPGERFATVGELAETLSKAAGGAQKMAQTMPLSAMPQAAQEMLRRVAAQPQGQPRPQSQPPAATQPAPQPYDGGSTLAVQSPVDMGWPPQGAQQGPPQGPPPGAGMPPGMGPGMLQGPGMQPGMQGPPGQMQGPPQGQQGPVLTPYGGFQAPPQAPGMQGGMPMGQPMGQAAPSFAPPASESVVVPKSKGGLVIVLALVGLVLIAGVVVLVVVLRQRAVVAALPPEATSEPAQTAAATTAPAATTAAPPASTAAAAASSAPAVETQPAGSASAAASGSAAPAGSAAVPDEAELTIVCTPDCDSVKVDDKALDATDAGTLTPTVLQVAAGAHTIAVTKATYMAQTKKVTLKPGQKAKEAFFMTKPGAVAVPRPCGKFLERCPN
ncbi:MAG TPA: serine/threonine-protein kinase [Polyangiaceae bacterium]